MYNYIYKENTHVLAFASMLICLVKQTTFFMLTQLPSIFKQA